MDPLDETAAAWGERALIRLMTERGGVPEVAGDPGSRVLVGPGDDAAVLRRPIGAVILTSDMLVEGRHFRLDWSSAEDVGHKAVAQNAADVEAMGGRTTAVTASIGCPPDLPARVLRDLARGMRDECAVIGAEVVGGDLVQAPVLIVAVTAYGESPVHDGSEAIGLGGARPGDTVAVAGNLGWSAAGLALLGARDAARAEAPGTYGSRTAAAERAVGLHRRPAPPYGAGIAAARAGATSLTDVSDGLHDDLAGIAAASGVHVDLDAVPVDADLAELAAGLSVDPRDWVLRGGEDHALVGTFRPGITGAGPARIGFRVIGTVVGEAPGGLVTIAGRIPTGEGWTAFA